MSFKVVYVVMVTECSEWDHFIAKYVKLCSQWVAAVESGPRTCSLIITSVVLSNIFQLFFLFKTIWIGCIANCWSASASMNIKQ